MVSKGLTVRVPKRLEQLGNLGVCDREGLVGDGERTEAKASIRYGCLGRRKKEGDGRRSELVDG